MFLFLSKLLPLLVYPLGLACVLVGLGSLLHRKPRGQRAVLITALLLLWLFSNRWMAAILARSLEWRYLSPADIPQVEVIVVLGGATDSALDPRPTIEVNGAGDRLLYAASLYRQGKAEYILLSGGRIDWLDAGRASAEDMADLLEWMGVPRQVIWLESESRNTYENAANCRAILAAKGIDRILLVTSAQHMPRSVGLFERQGFEVIPAPTDFSLTRAEWDALTHGSLPAQLISLLPSANHLAQTTSALKEYLGILIYWLRGWL